jgi:pimeloyl-ACP methyl ester carboxylesterase
MPVLAARHTVVVPDLRGAGGQASLGYDRKTMAIDIHELTTLLKLDRVHVVGHDIGLMVVGRRSRAGSNPPSTMARYRKLAHVGT